MILCRVLGNVVSAAQHPAYDGHKVLICQPVSGRGDKLGVAFLAVDAVQAGAGDLVLCSREGNTARQLLGGPDDPFHSVVLGVVDEVTLAT